MIAIDLQNAHLFRDRFINATPVPHVVIDECVVDAAALSDAFPGPDWFHWSELGSEYEENKFHCRDVRVFPKALQDVVQELTSAPFLEFLESATGIEALIPDPYFEGGGLHLSTGGGILAPHTDFHIYRRLNLYRQVNLILYLNEKWSDGDGGSLRLWDSKAPKDEGREARIDPLLGRIVIFKTDDRSVHGFTDPVAHGTLRKSIALYYYTAIDNSSFSGDFTTFWRHDGDDVGLSSIRLFLYRFLLEISRAFSFLAHLVNPRLGLRWWRTRRKKR